MDDPRAACVLRSATPTAGAGGPAGAVELYQPHGVYVDRDGTLYIADSSNNRILKIERGD
jgi:DNA-binding beta-propeller fold protein YncE